MTDEPEVFEVLRKIRYDLTAAQGKLTEAMRMLSDMNLGVDDKAKPYRCSCGFSFKTEARLLTHQQNVHGGPALPLSPHEEKA